MAPPNQTAAPDPARQPARKQPSTRVIVVAVLGVLLGVFGVLNSQTVRIHWIVTTSNVPLIVVILGCGLIGFVVGWLLARHRAARKPSA